MTWVIRFFVLAILLAWAVAQSAHANGGYGGQQLQAQQLQQDCYGQPQQLNVAPVQQVQLPAQVEYVQPVQPVQQVVLPAQRVYQPAIRQPLQFRQPVQRLQGGYCSGGAQGLTLPVQQGGRGYFKQKLKTKQRNR